MAPTINRNRLFTGCIVSLVATAFGFAVRASILENWRTEFNLTSEQIGYLQGAGLFPFAISIILFSLIIDRLGNGVSMAIAFTLHALSAVVTLAAPFALAGPGASPGAILAGQKTGFILLYVGTFIFALGNGTVEAVVNPVTATLFARDKTRYFNMLHAGWPGGLVLGGLLAIAVSYVDPASVPGRLWQWQMGLVLVPTIAYGLILFKQHFPVQERVAAKVPYFDMLQEFGAGSCFVVSFFLVAGLNQILVIAGVPTFGIAATLGIALIPTVLFALYVKSFGQPIFVLLLLVMVLLATTELGTDSWISDIMRTVLSSPTLGTLFLVWTSLIMFVLRFKAGPFVHRLGPLGLLATCSAIAAMGLLWLSLAGSAAFMLFAAATFYGFGKSFFWPTTLGVVSERYPRGGALMLNAIAGVGMISVGTIGNPGIGTVQDMNIVAEVRAADPTLAQQLIVERPGLFGESYAIDPARRALVTDPKQIELLTAIDSRSKQAALGKIAILPAIMLLCYLVLIAYFKAQGGYKAHHLVTAEVPRGMKFGVNTFIWAMEFDRSLLPLLPGIKEHGFDGVQVPLFRPADFIAAEIRKGAEANGLECTVCPILVDGLSFISEDAALRNKTRQHLKDVIKLAADAGSNTIAGPLYCPVGYLPGRRRNAEEWKWAIDAYQSATDTLSAYNMTMAIEPLNRFETYFLNTAADAAKLCDEVGHPNVGVLFDTFHANIEEKNIADAFRTVGKHLKHVHTCENDRGIPGSGHVEWPSVFQALRDIKYDGWLTIESFGFTLGDLSAAAAIWRDIEKTPESIAFEGVKFLKKSVAAIH